SSRRRHTRFSRDWSSDVCSSDLDLNGYIKGAYGTKDMRVGEGAINLPIVEDKVALRIGGQVRRQDGLNKNLSGGPDFDDTHQNGYRVSLLLNPTDNIENLTVYDHMSAKEQAGMGKDRKSVVQGK